jgi:serine/threonine protein kinase
MSDSPVSGSKSTPNEIIGRMAGEYRLRRKLGEGGFGAVYEAEHPVLKRRAAVKVLHRAAGRDSDAVLRFISEAQVVNQIRSRHIIDIFSFGQLPDGRHFYVMDLLEGEPLDRCLARETRFDIPTALQVLRPIAEALDATHAAGIVHRDLKPQNIFLAWEPGGEAVPKLLDFGMVKLLGDSTVHTLDGTPMGTPLYMSPEQARGDKVDGRADIYALGVLCHELLTGSLPMTGDSTVVVLMAHLVQAPPRVSEVCPDLPSELDEPILRMLAKDAGARPATAGAALADLVAAAERAGHVIPSGMPVVRRPPKATATANANANDSLDDLLVSEPEGNTGPTTAPNFQERGTPVLERKSGKWWIPAALAAVAIVVAGAFVVGSRMSGSLPLAPAASSAPTPTKTPLPAPAVAAASAVPAAVPAPAAAQPDLSPARPAVVGLTVRGAPRGARVWIDGKLIGEAPGPMPLPFGEMPLQLTITAAGYESTALDVVPGRPVTVTAKLKKRKAETSPRALIPSDLESPF